MKYLVIGLGTYGRELAINLSLQGNEVIGVDHRSENIEAVKEQLMTVYELDAKDENSLKLLPLKNMDIVIVAIGEDFGASLKTVALLKKNGVKHIYARAIDNLHQSILEAFNLERILTPEKRAANDLTLELSLNTQCSTFNITKDFMVLKFTAPEKFCRTQLSEHNFSRFGLVQFISAVRKVTENNLLGLSSSREEILDLERKSMEEKIASRDEIIVMGTRKNITDFLSSVQTN